MTGPLRWLYLKLAERLYAGWATAYDPVSTLVSCGQWARWQELALAYVEGEQVLELGFGPGHLLPRMSHPGRQVFGLDASPNMAVRAARASLSSTSRALIVQGSAEALPFLDASFDTIVATFPAPYIVHPHTVAECARISRTDRSGVRPSRLVVVGLWVRTKESVLPLVFPLFYGGPDWHAVSKYLASLTRAGFSPAVVEAAVGRFRVGAVVATKEASRGRTNPG